MPTATPFTALGRGNGFPFCLTYQSFDETIHAGEYTFTEAMQLFWNLQSFNLTINTDGPSTYTPLVSVNGWDLEEGIDKEPKDRVCNTYGNPVIGYDESSELYHLFVPEIIFNVFSFENSLISGTDFGFTLTDPYGGSWGISSQTVPGEDVISASMTFDFYTY